MKHECWQSPLSEAVQACLTPHAYSSTLVRTLFSEEIEKRSVLRSDPRALEPQQFAIALASAEASQLRGFRRWSDVVIVVATAFANTTSYTQK